MDQLQEQLAPDHVSILLTRGYSAIIDAADANRVQSRKWFAVNAGHTVYAYSAAQKSEDTAIALHTFLMAPRSGFVVDHRDGNGLDNRRSNLRTCTHKQNLRNQRAQIGRSSSLKGVSRHGRRWQACIRHDGETIHLGSFDDEAAAGRQYDRAARLLFGDFARTNEMLGLITRRAT